MKILICGAGRITDELLKRVGSTWEITLIEKKSAKIAPFSSRFPSIVRVMNEDASSPVVLEKAGLRNQDCVLAMTNDDKVNLAVVGFAEKENIKNILAVVRDPAKIPDFHKIKVKTISMSSDIAHRVYKFLKDPRVRISEFGEGHAELVELTAERQSLENLQHMAKTRDDHWRMAGVIRSNRLEFPDQINEIRKGDRLLFFGEPGLYNIMSNRLAQEDPHFPRSYGQQMILGIGDDEGLDVAELLNEALYMARGTHIEQIRVACSRESEEIHQVLSRWSESLQIDINERDIALHKSIVADATSNDAGIAVLGYTRKLSGHFFSHPYMKIAGKLPCPLLVSKFSDPYERILVPFNGSLSGQRAVEIALDLARQLDAEVSVIVVVEPSYLHGSDSPSGQWENQLLSQIRELSRIYKIKVEEHVRHGNPVKEILAMAEDYQLLVISSDAYKSGFFSISVAGMLVNRSPVSLLLVS